ncbi:GAP family protein [Nocardioides sp. BP30]|uniref:GAP family protein n=1 Tax=Nocardioides sp. BP30 TaxID=3036374 RepID=UPI00246876E5|nr:GAP family protein [Nocardioides sp. BP30]WGL53520.1 GAP family protein [Nocardioides sp. BP30]
MGEAIGGLLPVAVGVAISPFPIIGMVLMLLTPKAKPNGFSFLLGWVGGIAVAGTLVILVVNAIGASGDDHAPATWTYWLKLVLGVALLLLGVRRWQGRPHAGEEVALPKWMAALADFTPVRSVGLAVLLSAVNPKNLILVIGGATTLVQAELSTGQDVVAWAVFTVIATIGVAAPLGIYLFLGDRAVTVLDGLNAWMSTNNAAIMAVLILVFGTKLVGEAIAGIF